MAFAGVLGFGGHFAGADGFNRGNQSRQHRGLREGHVVLAEDEFELRSQRSEVLYRSDVVIQIGLRTIEPDGRRIVSVAGEEQAVGAIEQANRIRSVAWSGENFQSAAAEIDAVVVVKKAGDLPGPGCVGFRVKAFR